MNIDDPNDMSMRLIATKAGYGRRRPSGASRSNRSGVCLRFKPVKARRGELAP